ncbi:hypothetical protein HOV23_gp086 [Pseudomonas phage Lana]|uniref:Uncharacterized protein n=1 Tax=Pseudomonas phage Lana TaxID=2530172 RepID=A0A481W6I4_9CAUD|nr:hypothetical protein HOV23_gp086 [Pseudomonas phage Lana]QBJ04487.1 hypothetical protein [Pseudomonas phage Lana]
MPRILWLFSTCAFIAFVCLVYLATKVPSLFVLVGLVAIFWIVLSWKIRRIIKKRS